MSLDLITDHCLPWHPQLTFKIEYLPSIAQISPVNGFITEDFNKDGITDILLAGNMYQTEAETSRADASIGAFINGKDMTTMENSGFFVPEDVKDVTKIKIGENGIGILVSSNNDQLKLFTWNK